MTRHTWLRHPARTIPAPPPCPAGARYASQALAVLRGLGVDDDDPRVNPNGGAIALGHPLGMSGARLALTLTEELGRGGGRYGIATMCVGVGQGVTMLIERVSITIAEEGLRPALVRAGWSIAVAMSIWPIFRSARAEHLMFTFPELVIAVIGVLVWIGGYTGYRLSDLLRFRAFAQPAAEEAP